MMKISSSFFALALNWGDAEILEWGPYY